MTPSTKTSAKGHLALLLVASLLLTQPLQGFAPPQEPLAVPAAQLAKFVLGKKVTMQLKTGRTTKCVIKEIRHNTTGTFLVSKIRDTGATEVINANDIRTLSFRKRESKVAVIAIWIAVVIAGYFGVMTTESIWSLAAAYGGGVAASLWLRNNRPEVILTILP